MILKESMINVKHMIGLDKLTSIKANNYFH